MVKDRYFQVHMLIAPMAVDPQRLEVQVVPINLEKVSVIYPLERHAYSGGEKFIFKMLVDGVLLDFVSGWPATKQGVTTRRVSNETWTASTFQEQYDRLLAQYKELLTS